MMSLHGFGLATMMNTSVILGNGWGFNTKEAKRTQEILIGLQPTFDGQGL